MLAKSGRMGYVLAQCSLAPDSPDQVHGSSDTVTTATDPPPMDSLHNSVTSLPAVSSRLDCSAVPGASKASGPETEEECRIRRKTKSREKQMTMCRKTMKELREWGDHIKIHVDAHVALSLRSALFDIQGSDKEKFLGKAVGLVWIDHEGKPIMVA